MLQCRSKQAGWFRLSRQAAGAPPPHLQVFYRRPVLLLRPGVPHSLHLLLRHLPPGHQVGQWHLMAGGALAERQGRLGTRRLCSGGARECEGGGGGGGGAAGSQGRASARCGAPVQHAVHHVWRQAVVALHSAQALRKHQGPR